VRRPLDGHRLSCREADQPLDIIEAPEPTYLVAVASAEEQMLE